MRLWIIYGFVITESILKELVIQCSYEKWNQCDCRFNVMWALLATIDIVLLE